MDVDLFDFDLPEERIALRPAEPRDSARLLHVGEALSDHRVTDLPSLLQPGDLLVLNDSRVFPAALKGVRPARAHGGGGDVSVDVNLLERAFGSEGYDPERDWVAFVRPAKRLRDGDALSFGALSATVMSRNGAQAILRFDRSGAALDQAFEAVGHMPLPPYIGRRRAVDERDATDYQTVYADPDKSGSVAAPTAGLHFTPDLFEALGARGVEVTQVTLHVGAGTFLPVSAEDTADHEMHSEHFIIAPSAAEAVNRAKREGRRVVAVGTTALRTLEGARREGGVIVPQAHDTDIFITPGYDFQTVDGLMTNFHLPRSTLFMLVSALAGLDRMQAAYAHAIKTGYRFYSYGDSSLIWRR
ncbi:MAG: tRNA preQ1(34) S-adenosylmethionine ribosyltransferase-isomerase QueA [Pseudomonadota bacterium]